MALFNKPKAGGFMDEIRCDEPSYLIWKWHPVGSEKGNNNRENAIRWGSSLRVKDGEVAVFVYKQENGTMQDFIVGPFDQTIKTANLPVLASLVGLAFEGGTPFQAEVYFINLAHIIQVKFGVPFFDVYDPRFLDFGVPTAVRGTISFKIVVPYISSYSWLNKSPTNIPTYENFFNVDTPYSAKECIGKEYEIVKDDFRRSGFTNISLGVIEDLEISEADRDGIVESVSINGVSDFEGNVEFKNSSKIVITYHSFKNIGVPFSSDEAKSMDTELTSEVPYTPCVRTAKLFGKMY